MVKVSVVLLFATVIGGSVVCLMVLPLIGLDPNTYVVWVMAIMMAIYLLAARRYGKRYLTERNATIELIAELARHGSPRSIPALIEAFRSGRLTDTRAQHCASQALYMVLSQLATSGGMTLTAEHRRTMRDLILDPMQRHVPRDSFSRPTDKDRAGYTTRRRDSALALLKVYEQIGNADDSAAVSLIASGKHPLGLDEQVRLAAERCLACIKDRADGNASSTTLLRAADSTLADAGNLLRPSTDTITTPGELMRASGGGNGTTGASADEAIAIDHQINLG
jgi:hypothetical protein